MNSTLQCLAHTGPLRRYFVQGGYEADLNRDNPLGTGGNLTTAFADLLKEMWGVRTGRDGGVTGTGAGGGGGSGAGGIGPSLLSPSPSYGPYPAPAHGPAPAVYPRSFKTTLGRYAEQFVGYDQHDSQELATFLLDALHEDTNRVTSKPYVEKPEKGEDETDDQAAARAWELHLRREDSHILESFVGQIKSRLQCPKPDCAMVSTTFDPMMFLSVPIPGASDRTLSVTYVPLDPHRRRIKLTLTLNRQATIAGLKQRIKDTLREGEAEERGEGGKGGTADAGTVEPGDLRLADIFHRAVYSTYADEDLIDKIRDTDDTHAFQLRPVALIHEEAEAADAAMAPAMAPVMAMAPAMATEGGGTAAVRRGDPAPPPKAAAPPHANRDIDEATTGRLDKDDEWMRELDRYVCGYTRLSAMLHRNRSSHEEKLDFHAKMRKFARSLRACPDSVISYPEREEEDPAGGDDPVAPSAMSVDRGLVDEEFELDGDDESDDDVEIVPDGPSLEEKCEINSTFENICSARDFAIFEYCVGKYLEYVERLKYEEATKYKDGLEIQVKFLRREANQSASYSYSSEKEKEFANPIILRISPQLTVRGLRKVLADRVSRSLKTDFADARDEEEKKADGDVSMTSELEGPGPAVDDGSKGDISHKKSKLDHDEKLTPLDIVRQIPLTYVKKTHGSTRWNAESSYRKLGALMRQEEGHLTTHPNTFASPTDEGEAHAVADLVGNKGVVSLHWPVGLSGRSFDEVDFEAIQASPKKPVSEESQKVTSLLDCIAKYCETEQLEETETWYCGKCKDHVRGWKHDSIYRAPPILIVHLKRFQYSATTHRRDKIDTFIDFPLKGLDLTEYVKNWENGEEPIYDLYAVSNHFGGLGGGHYTAYALSDDGEWCNFDDSRVSTGVKEEEVVSSAAYCLYFRRKDVPKEVVPIDDAMEIVPETDDLQIEANSHLLPLVEAQKSPRLLLSDQIDDMNVSNEGDSSLHSNDSSRTAFLDNENIPGDPHASTSFSEYL